VTLVAPASLKGRRHGEVLVVHDAPPADGKGREWQPRGGGKVGGHAGPGAPFKGKAQGGSIVSVEARAAQKGDNAPARVAEGTVAAGGAPAAAGAGAVHVVAHPPPSAPPAAAVATEDEWKVHMVRAATGTVDLQLPAHMP